jgi:hypothetical protein
MIVLDPANFVTITITDDESRRFEDFLDRNFPGWRDREIMKLKCAGTIRRKWDDGHDGIERNAVFRKQYVEIYDEFIDLDQTDEADIHYLKTKLCAIDGDLTPVAIWRSAKTSS